MAFEANVQSYGMFPMGATPTGRYRGVLLSAAGELDLAGAGSQWTGIVMLDGANAGQATRVQYAGIAKVVAGAALTVGTAVAFDATGAAVAAATGDYYVGTVVEVGESAAAAGDLISVDLERSLVPAP